MAFEISKGFNLLTKALEFRRIRQDLIASNIANADTPYYRPRDIRFEDALKAEMDKEFNKPSKKLQLAITNEKHLLPKDFDNTKAIVFFRDGHLARNDGNSVDIDIETSEMAKNTLAYNSIVAAIRKDIEIFKAVIDSSKNI